MLKRMIHAIILFDFKGSPNLPASGKIIPLMSSLIRIKMKIYLTIEVGSIFEQYP